MKKLKELLNRKMEVDAVTYYMLLAAAWINVVALVLDCFV